MNESSNYSISSVKLIRCNGSFFTIYVNVPATGAHFYSIIAYIIVNILLSVAGICLNVLVWLVFWRNKSVRTSSNMLLVVLALSDFLVNAIVQPLSIARVMYEIRGTPSCVLMITARLSSYCCCGISLLTIAIICIERFITLAFPYQYQNMLTPLRLKIIVSATWALTFIFASLHLGPVSFTTISAVGNIFIVLSITIVFLTWFGVNRIVRRHRVSIDCYQTPGSQKGHLKRQATLRTTWTSYMICGAVLVFYFPSLVMLAYTATQDYDFAVMFLILPWAETVMFSNSVLNPSLLFWRKSTFRESAKALLKKA